MWGEAFHFHSGHELEQRLDIDPRRLHQAVGKVGVGFVFAEDAADQGVAVGMRATGGKAQQHVAGLNGLAVDDAFLLDHADAESGQVVLALRVHAGHFRGFAADQGAAGLLAAFGDAADDVGGDGLVQFAAGEVIEEEERFGALHEDVVHAHRHQIDADGAVPAEHEGELELGAYAIGSGHQDRLLVLRGDRAQRAEAAKARQHFGAQGTLREGLDGLDERVAGVDVHAGVTVREGFRHGR